MVDADDSGYTEEDLIVDDLTIDGLNEVDWNELTLDELAEASKNFHEALLQFAAALSAAFKPILEDREFMNLVGRIDDIFILDTSEESDE